MKVEIELSVKRQVILPIISIIMSVILYYSYQKLQKYSVVFNDSYNGSYYDFMFVGSKGEIPNLYFKVSNIVKKDGKISCDIEVPYAVIKNKAFKERNFLIRIAIIAKNYLLNIVSKIFFDDRELINLENQIQFKFRNQKGHILLRTTVRDFFAFVVEKKYRFETILTNDKKFFGFKLFDNKKNELYYFKNSAFLLGRRNNKYISSREKIVNDKDISKEQFQQALNDFKNCKFTDKFFKKYPIIYSFRFNYNYIYREGKK